MEFDAYEEQMINVVNRNAEEKSKCSESGTPDSAAKPKQKLFTKTDSAALKLGLKRMMVALFTAILFAISILGLIITAIAQGYLAVLLFLASIVVLGCAFIFLYAQGLTNKTHTERQGDDKW